MKRPGLEKFKDFFGQKAKEEKKMSSNEYGEIYIDIGWLFSNLLGIEILKEAIANTMKKASLASKIKGFAIIINGDNVMLQVDAGWKKINIELDPSIKSPDRNNIQRIELDTLENQIVKVLNEKKISKIIDLQSSDMSDEQIEQLKNIFDEPNGKKVTLQGVKDAIDDTFNNLVDYYKYLEELKKDSEKADTIRIEVNHNSDTNTYRGQNVSPSPKHTKRVNPFTAFDERERILNDANRGLIKKIIIDEKCEDGEVHEKSYVGYVYNNFTRKGCTDNGYLFVFEDPSGDRSTRIVYLSQEKFTQFKVEDGKDRCAEIAKRYLEMSRKEFSEANETITLLHGSTFIDRLTYIFEGDKTKAIGKDTKFFNNVNTLLSGFNTNADSMINVAIGPKLGKGGKN